MQLLFAVVGALYLAGDVSLTERGYIMIVPLAHILILAGILFGLGPGLPAGLAEQCHHAADRHRDHAQCRHAGVCRRLLPLGQPDGQVFALMIMAMTSAEVSLALAMVVYLHRRQQDGQCG